MIYIELLIVLAAIFIGARVGGIGLGIFGMLGLSILVFGFGLAPGKAPIDVMLIIVAVITAAATLQAAGGLDYLVKVAEKILRKNPAMVISLHFSLGQDILLIHSYLSSRKLLPTAKCALSVHSLSQ